MKKEEITKLEAKVAKDPSSTLFVPLAEEYRKQERLDDAVRVLSTGIEQQPNYMSARVALGRIFFEKSMMDEARAQFETVVEAIPDNLFARQRLADIYQQQGEFELARAQVEEIIRLNPTVFDGERFRNDLGVRMVSEGWSQPRRIVKDVPELDETTEDVSDGPVSDPEDEGAPEDEGMVQEPAGELPETDELTDELIDQEPAERLPVTDERTDPEPAERSSASALPPAPDTEPDREYGETETLETAPPAPPETTDPVNEGDETQPDEPEAEPEFVDSGVDPVPPVLPEIPEPASEMSRGASAEIVTESMARVYIEQGHFDEALAVYEKLYKQDPGDRKLLQSLTDLKMLLTLHEQKRVREKLEKREESLGKLGGFLHKVRRWGESGVS